MVAPLELEAGFEDDENWDVFAIDLGRWKPNLHPRDSKGRFRDKWGLSPKAMQAVDRLLAAFSPPPLRSDAHAASLLKGSKGPKRTPKQIAALRAFLTREGNENIQSTLRAGDEDTPAIRELKGMVRPLPHDLILSRVVGPDAFGLRGEQIDGVEEWSGKKVLDHGFQPMNAGSPYQVAGPHVEMRVLVPRGTPAIVVGDDGGPDEARTVILAPDTPLQIGTIQSDGRGGWYAMATVAPSQGTGRSVGLSGRKLGAREMSPAEEATPEAFERRGLNPEADGGLSPQAPPDRFGPATGGGTGERQLPQQPGQQVQSIPNPASSGTGTSAQQIQEGGGEIPVGAGGQGAPTPRKKIERSPDRQVEPEAAGRARAEKRAAATADREARDRTRREAAAQKVADAREKRLQELETRADERDAQAREESAQAREQLAKANDSQAKTIEQQSALIDRLMALDAERAALPSSEGGTNPAGMTRAQKRAMVRQAERIGDQKGGENDRIRKVAQQIRDSGEDLEAAPAPAKAAKAAKKATKAAKKATKAAAPEAAPEAPKATPNLDRLLPEEYDPRDIDLSREQADLDKGVPPAQVSQDLRDRATRMERNVQAQRRAADPNDRREQDRLDRSERQVQGIRDTAQQLDDTQAPPSPGRGAEDIDADYVAGLTDAERRQLANYRADNISDLQPIQAKDLRKLNTEQEEIYWARRQAGFSHPRAMRGLATAPSPRTGRKRVAPTKRVNRVGTEVRGEDLKELRPGDVVDVPARNGRGTERKTVRVVDGDNVVFTDGTTHSPEGGELRVREQGTLPLSPTAAARRKKAQDRAAAGMGLDEVIRAFQNGEVTPEQAIANVRNKLADLRKLQLGLQRTPTEGEGAPAAPVPKGLMDDLDKAIKGLEGFILEARGSRRETASKRAEKSAFKKAARDILSPDEIGELEDIQAARTAKKATKGITKKAAPRAAAEAVPESAPDAERVNAVRQAKQLADINRIAQENGVRIPSTIGRREDRRAFLENALKAKPGESKADYDARMEELKAPKPRGRGRPPKALTPAPEVPAAEAPAKKAPAKREITKAAPVKASTVDKATPAQSPVEPAPKPVKVTRAAKKAAATEAVETPKFTARNSKEYRPTKLVKTARLVNTKEDGSPLGPNDETVIEPEWGGEQRFKGPFMEVLGPDGTRAYGSALDEWNENNERVPGSENGWVKVTPVTAYQHKGEPRRVETVLKDGTKETSNVANDGDWVVRQPNGEVQVIKDSEFRSRYQTDAPQSVGTHARFVKKATAAKAAPAKKAPAKAAKAAVPEAPAAETPAKKAARPIVKRAKAAAIGTPEGKKIVKDYVSGSTIEETAAKNGVTPAVARRALREHGVSIRPRGGARVKKAAPEATPKMRPQGIVKKAAPAKKAPAKKAATAAKKAAPEAPAKKATRAAKKVAPEAAPVKATRARKAAPAAPEAAPAKRAVSRAPSKKAAPEFKRERLEAMGPRARKQVDALQGPGQEEYFKRLQAGESHTAALRHAEVEDGKVRNRLALERQARYTPESVENNTPSERRAIAKYASDHEDELNAREAAQVRKLRDTSKEAYWQRRRDGGTHAESVQGLDSVGPEKKTTTKAATKAVKEAAPAKVAKEAPAAKAPAKRAARPVAVRRVEASPTPGNARDKRRFEGAEDKDTIKARADELAASGSTSAAAWRTALDEHDFRQRQTGAPEAPTKKVAKAPAKAPAKATRAGLPSDMTTDARPGSSWKDTGEAVPEARRAGLRPDPAKRHKGYDIVDADGNRVEEGLRSSTAAQARIRQLKNGDNVRRLEMGPESPAEIARQERESKAQAARQRAFLSPEDRAALDRQIAEREAVKAAPEPPAKAAKVTKAARSQAAEPVVSAPSTTNTQPEKITDVEKMTQAKRDRLLKRVRDAGSQAEAERILDESVNRTVMQDIAQNNPGLKIDHTQTIAGLRRDLAKAMRSTPTFRPLRAEAPPAKKAPRTVTPETPAADGAIRAMLNRLPADTRRQVLESMTPEQRQAVDAAVARQEERLSARKAARLAKRATPEVSAPPAKKARVAKKAATPESEPDQLRRQIRREEAYNDAIRNGDADTALRLWDDDYKENHDGRLPGPELQANRRRAIERQIREQQPTKAVEAPATKRVQVKRGGKAITAQEARRESALDAIRANEIEGGESGGYRNILQNVQSGDWTPARARMEAKGNEKYWRQQGRDARGFGRATPEERRRIEAKHNKTADRYARLADAISESQSKDSVDKRRFEERPAAAKKAARKARAPRPVLSEEQHRNEDQATRDFMQPFLDQAGVDFDGLNETDQLGVTLIGDQLRTGKISRPEAVRRLKSGRRRDSKLGDIGDAIAAPRTKATKKAAKATKAITPEAPAAKKTAAERREERDTAKMRRDMEVLSRGGYRNEGEATPAKTAAPEAPPAKAARPERPVTVKRQGAKKVAKKAAAGPALKYRAPENLRKEEGDLTPDEIAQINDLTPDSAEKYWRARGRGAGHETAWRSVPKGESIEELRRPSQPPGEAGTRPQGSPEGIEALRQPSLQFQRPRGGTTGRLDEETKDDIIRQAREARAANPNFPITPDEQNLDREAREIEMARNATRALAKKGEPKAPAKKVAERVSKTRDRRSEQYARSIENLLPQMEERDKRDSFLARSAVEDLRKGEPATSVKERLAHRAEFHRDSAEIISRQPNVDRVDRQQIDEHMRLAELYDEAAGNAKKKVARVKGEHARGAKIPVVDLEDGDVAILDGKKGIYRNPKPRTTFIEFPDGSQEKVQKTKLAGMVREKKLQLLGGDHRPEKVEGPAKAAKKVSLKRAPASAAAVSPGNAADRRRLVVVNDTDGSVKARADQLVREDGKTSPAAWRQALDEAEAKQKLPEKRAAMRKVVGRTTPAKKAPAVKKAAAKAPAKKAVAKKAPAKKATRKMQPFGVIRRQGPGEQVQPEADSPARIIQDLDNGQITRAEARARIRAQRERIRNAESNIEEPAPRRGLRERIGERVTAARERLAERRQRQAAGRAERQQRGAEIRQGEGPDLRTEARDRGINTRDSAIREALDAQDTPNAYRALRKLDSQIIRDRQEANLLDYGTREAPEEQPRDYTGGLSARSRRLRRRANQRAELLHLVFERGHRHEATPRMRPMGEVVPMGGRTAKKAGRAAGLPRGERPVTVLRKAAKKAAPAEAPAAPAPAKATRAIKKAAPRVAFDRAETMRRLNGPDAPGSREEANALLEGASRVDLHQMARELSVPRANTLTKDALRREVVDATVGRKLDSIATRGFRGARPGDVIDNRDLGSTWARNVVKDANRDLLRGDSRDDVVDRLRTAAAQLQSGEVKLDDADMPDRLHRSDEEMRDIRHADARNLDRLADQLEADKNLPSATPSGGIAKVAAKAAEAAPRKRGARRVSPIDPVGIYADGGESGLRARLADMDTEQLRDVIAGNGMDPGRRLARTKDRNRLEDLIVERSQARSTKGQAFRTPPAKKATRAAKKTATPQVTEPPGTARGEIQELNAAEIRAMGREAGVGELEGDTPDELFADLDRKVRAQRRSAGAKKAAATRAAKRAEAAPAPEAPAAPAAKAAPVPAKKAARRVMPTLSPSERRDVSDLGPEEQREYRSMRRGGASHADAMEHAPVVVQGRNSARAARSERALAKAQAAKKVAPEAPTKAAPVKKAAPEAGHPDVREMAKDLGFTKADDGLLEDVQDLLDGKHREQIGDMKPGVKPTPRRVAKYLRSTNEAPGSPLLRSGIQRQLASDKRPGETDAQFERRRAAALAEADQLRARGKARADLADRIEKIRTPRAAKKVAPEAATPETPAPTKAARAPLPRGPIRDTTARAKAWGRENGYSGYTGGWISNPSKPGEKRVQGWDSLYKAHKGEIDKWEQDRLKARDEALHQRDEARLAAKAAKKAAPAARAAKKVAPEAPSINRDFEEEDTVSVAGRRGTGVVSEILPNGKVRVDFTRRLNRTDTREDSIPMDREKLTLVRKGNKVKDQADLFMGGMDIGEAMKEADRRDRLAKKAAKAVPTAAPKGPEAAPVRTARVLPSDREMFDRHEGGSESLDEAMDNGFTWDGPEAQIPEKARRPLRNFLEMRQEIAEDNLADAKRGEPISAAQLAEYRAEIRTSKRFLAALDSEPKKATPRMRPMAAEKTPGKKAAPSAPEVPLPDADTKETAPTKKAPSRQKHEIKLPDGTIATRTSDRRNYTHAVVITKNNHKEADRLERIADLNAQARKDYEEAVRTGDWSKFERVGDGGSTRHRHWAMRWKQPRGEGEGSEIRFPSALPKDMEADQKDWQRSYDEFEARDKKWNAEHPDAKMPMATKRPWYSEHDLTPEEYRRRQVEGALKANKEYGDDRLRADAKKLRERPEEEYYVSRWSSSRANAERALSAREVKPDASTYKARVVEVGTDMSGGKETGGTRAGVARGGAPEAKKVAKKAPAAETSRLGEGIRLRPAAKKAAPAAPLNKREQQEADARARLKEIDDRLRAENGGTLQGMNLGQLQEWNRARQDVSALERWGPDPKWATNDKEVESGRLVVSPSNGVVQIGRAIPPGGQGAIPKSKEDTVLVHNSPGMLPNRYPRSQVESWIRDSDAKYGSRAEAPPAKKAARVAKKAAPAKVTPTKAARPKAVSAMTDEEVMNEAKGMRGSAEDRRQRAILARASLIERRREREMTRKRKEGTATEAEAPMKVFGRSDAEAAPAPAKKAPAKRVAKKAAPEAPAPAPAKAAPAKKAAPRVDTLRKELLAADTPEKRREILDSHDEGTTLTRWRALAKGMGVEEYPYTRAQAKEAIERAVVDGRVGSPRKSLADDLRATNVDMSPKKGRWDHHGTEIETASRITPDDPEALRTRAAKFEHDAKIYRDLAGMVEANRSDQPDRVAALRKGADSYDGAAKVFRQRADAIDKARAPHARKPESERSAPEVVPSMPESPEPAKVTGATTRGRTKFSPSQIEMLRRLEGGDLSQDDVNGLSTSEKRDLNRLTNHGLVHRTTGTRDGKRGFQSRISDEGRKELAKVDAPERPRKATKATPAKAIEAERAAPAPPTPAPRREVPNKTKAEYDRNKREQDYLDAIRRGDADEAARLWREDYEQQYGNPPSASLERMRRRGITAQIQKDNDTGPAPTKAIPARPMTPKQREAFDSVRTSSESLQRESGMEDGWVGEQDIPASRTVLGNLARRGDLEEREVVGPSGRPIRQYRPAGTPTPGGDTIHRQVVRPEKRARPTITRAGAKAAPAKKAAPEGMQDRLDRYVKEHPDAGLGKVPDQYKRGLVTDDEAIELMREADLKRNKGQVKQPSGPAVRHHDERRSPFRDGWNPQPRAKEDEKLLAPNGGADQGTLHMDSQIGQLWEDLYQDDRVPNSTLNKITMLGDSLGRRGSDKTINDVAPDLRRLADDAPDTGVADRIRKVADELDVPRKPVPDLPDDTPKPLRDFIEKLNENGTARRTGRFHHYNVEEGNSLVDQVAKLYRDISEGRGDQDRSRMDPIGAILQKYHESTDGAYPLKRLNTDTEERELTKWRREVRRRGGSADAGVPGPAKAPVAASQDLTPSADADRVTTARDRLAGRQKTARIERARGAAQLAALVKNTLDNHQGDENDPSFRKAIDQDLKGAIASEGPRDELAKGGEALKKAMRGSPRNKEGIRERLRQTLDRMGMKIEHEPGDQVPFDPDTMDGPMERVLHRGDMVRVTRSGISYRDEDGSVHPVVRTRVRRDTEGGGNPLGSPAPSGSRRSPRMRPLEGPAGMSGDRVRREPSAPKTAAEKGVLTGHQGKAPLGEVGGDRNTGPDGVPIRDFQLRALDPDSDPDSGYKISHGTYFRTKGVPYLVEHEDSPEGREHAKRVHRVLEAHRESLPASVRGLQTGYAWVDGANPEDDQFAIEQGRAPGEFLSLASSDTVGGTYLFNRETYGASGLNGTLNHEFAHTLDYSKVLSGHSSKSARWQEAAIHDAKVRSGFRGFVSGGRQSPVRTRRKARGSASTFPEGVTDYGTANADEDYAESFRLYRTGPIGTAKAPGGGTEPVYFRDLFPERAAILDEIMPDFAREQKAEIAEMRRTGEVPFLRPEEERVARAIRDITERPSGGTPRMRPMAAVLPERAAVGSDGILRGRISQEREISDLLGGPDVPEGIPVRDLTLGRHSNYQMKSGRLYRFNGVNYLVEHDNDEGAGSSLQAQRRVLDRVRIEHEQLPPELRQHVKSYTTLLRPDPFDQRLLDETGEVFETGAQAKRNDVTIFGMGLNDDGWRAHRIRHVIPHESGHTADYSFDWISGKPEWQTQARIRPNRVYDFVQNDSKDISHVRLEPAFGQPFPWGVTNYGLSNVEEDFAESLRLYLFGIIGRGAPTQGGQPIDVWFRDVYPERAAVLDRLFPDFARRQAEQIARARGY